MTSAKEEMPSSTAPTAPPPYEPVKPPIESTYVTIENQNMGHMEVPQVVVLAESLGPPQLPPLTRGEQIRRGPLLVTVNDEMVRRREQENAELRRRWLIQEERRRERDEKYHGEFKDYYVRRRFIRKIFSILSLQLIFTAAVVAFFMFHEPANKFLKHYPWSGLIAIMVMIIPMCSISCCDCARHDFPINYMCLFIFTSAMSYMAAATSVYYQLEVVLMAVGLTAAVTFLISIVAATTSFDLTRYPGVVCIISFVIIIAMFCLMYLGIGHFKINVLQMVIGLMGSFLISLFLFYDVQTIMGGRHIEIAPNEVVYATMLIYYDIAMLYQYLLIFMGGASE